MCKGLTDAHKRVGEAQYRGCDHMHMLRVNRDVQVRVHLIRLENAHWLVLDGK